MSNSEAFAALAAHIDRCKKLPGLAKAAASEMADALEREIVAQIARGESPEGEKWQPTQKGAAPLTGAAGALKVGSIGTVIIARITGPEALHSVGYARGGIERKIMLTELTPATELALQQAAHSAFEALMVSK